MRTRTFLSVLTIPLLAACGASTDDPGSAQSTSEAVDTPETVSTTSIGREATRIQHSHDIRHVLLLSIDGLHEQEGVR